MTYQSPNGFSPQILTQPSTDASLRLPQLQTKTPVTRGSVFKFADDLTWVIPHYVYLPCLLGRESIRLFSLVSHPDPAGLFRMNGHLFTTVSHIDNWIVYE